jgi:glycosyltransferase involved in cell wall biosynthesis
MTNKKKVIRITTVPISLQKLLTGQLRFMNSFYHVIGVSSDKENLEKVKQNEGIDVFVLEMTRKITPFQDLKALIKLFVFLKKEKPYIVHTHTPKAGTLGMIAAKLARVPNRLHTVAGLPLLEEVGIKRKLLDIVERITYHCATNVYPNSFGLKNIILKNNYCKQTKIKVLANGSSNGIDTNYFNSTQFDAIKKVRLKEKLGITNEDFVFIFVGRLVKDKGINELIIAFEKLQKEIKHIRLMLVGDFENELDPLDAITIESIKTNDAIIFTGFQVDVRLYFAISNALVFPSYREGFPNVVMQAGAMNLPSIVSNINGCNEIIQDKINGYIIDVKSEKAIYDGMKAMINNPNLYHEMRNKSRQIIITNFDQKFVWNSILNEYNSL